MATLITLSSLKQTLPAAGNTTNNVRDVSFSSSLSTTDEKFVRKLADSTCDLAPNIQGNKEDDSGEIGVFSAEKYFNGVIEVDHSARISKFNIPNKQPKQEQVDLLPPQPKLIPPSSTTPSVRSESSWNSQIALLLQNSHRKTNKPNRKARKGFLAGLGCNCMCSDSDSIAVEDQQYLGEISFKKGNTFLQTKQDPQDFHLSAVTNLETQRKSLEVFGSPLQDKKVKSFRMETRPSMLGITDYSSALPDEDSDGSSSDLFEIESLTGKANPFLARQGSDETSGCVSPTTCYAPSEASIEWSVVTASAADFSVKSDYGEIRPPITTNNFVSNKTLMGDTRRRRSSMLLGCNSSKAVRVADRITNDKPNVEHGFYRVSDSYVPAIRFPPEDKMMELEFDSTPRQRAFSTLSLPRSIPPQPSRLFFIH